MSLARSTDALAAAAQALLAGEVRALVPARPGGNNRVYRVDCGDGRSFALKAYLRQPGDANDRLAAEFLGLRFLRRHGVRAVPDALEVDRGTDCALYEWVEGEAVARPGPDDIDAALAFLGALYRLAGDPEARTLPDAAEACLSAAEVAAQLDRRLSRLRATAARRPDLERFLDDELAPRIGALIAETCEGYAAAGLAFGAEIAPEARTLSPSDFGFHNALRRKDGELVFVDFEYFGWDDPVKLVADFLLHPGMVLDDSLKRRFLRGALAIFAADPAFADRLRLLHPLFGLRWCLILLNEFVPERWRRRAYAGAADDRAQAEARQLAKARAMLDRVATTPRGLPHDA